MIMNIKTKSTFILLALLMVTKLAFSQDLKIPEPNFPSEFNTSIRLFLEEIPSEILSNYGINNQAEINKATIGKPIAVYTIKNGSLSFTNTWRVPLVIDNEYRALFTIHKNSDDEYKIVDFGAVLLAEEFFKFKKENDFSAMLRVYELRTDYFMCEDSVGEWKFQPISNQEKSQYSLNELINIIK